MQRKNKKIVNFYVFFYEMKKTVAEKATVMFKYVS